MRNYCLIKGRVRYTFNNNYVIILYKCGFSCYSGEHLALINLCKMERFFGNYSPTPEKPPPPPGGGG
jgi:hypothetical protein